MGKPSTRVRVRDLRRMVAFFETLGWTVENGPAGHAWIDTPGGRFVLEQATDPAPVPRLELALAVPDPVAVDELAELVEPTGGITMEPLQETAWGGWGFSFNDPEGNNWEIGSPTTVTHVDMALVVPPRLPATV